MFAPSIFPTQLQKLTLILAICDPALAIFFDVTATDCLVGSSLINSVPYLKFTVQPGRTCWEYCKYLKNCTAVSFDLETSGVCSLYNDPNIDFQLIGQDSFYIGEKSCLKKVDLQRIFESMNDTEASGVYLQQSATGACLAVGSTPWDWGDGRLHWAPHCNETMLWIIEIVNIAQYGNYVRIKDKESRSCVTTTMMESRCQFLKCHLAVMSVCSQKVAQNQTFLLISTNVLSPEMLKWYLRSTEPSGRLTLIPTWNQESEQHVLTGFNLVEEYFTCDKLNVTHGVTLLDTSQPLYIPGETIPVICDPGYGVKNMFGSGYSRYTTTVCSNNLIVPNCTRVPPVHANFVNPVRCEEIPGTLTIPSGFFYFLLLFVLLTMVIFLITLQFMQRRQIKRLKKEKEEDVPDECSQERD